jgi:MFS transporter, DHA1 family, multidrug resistance protein
MHQIGPTWPRSVDVDRGVWMTARGESSASSPTAATGGRTAGTATVTTALILTLALQSAVPPFATDMYTPAFPRVTSELATSASLVGLTLTTFFLGMALGQLLGGPLSDQRGRRKPMIVGGLICTLGAVGCALAPSIGLLIVFRVVQGFGGGFAAVVARAVVVDVAKGDVLAKVMSIMMALGGLAPMVAPVLGGAVLTLGGDLADRVLVLGRVRVADADHRDHVRARVAAR